MVKLPSSIEIAAAFEKWQSENRMPNKKVLFEEYEKACAALKIHAKSYGIFVGMMKGEKLGYDDLRAILEILKIEDFDIFLDECRAVNGVKLNELTPCEKLSDWAFDAAGTSPRGYRVHSKTMGRNRTRMDTLIFVPKQDTGWTSHPGHEFVKVLNGTIHCRFAELKAWNPNEKSAPPPLDFENPDYCYDLEENGAVIFPSRLWHRFVNLTDDDVEIAVARPTHSNRNLD